MDRRQFLAGLTAAGGGGVAGCIEQLEESDQEPATGGGRGQEPTQEAWSGEELSSAGATSECNADELQQTIDDAAQQLSDLGAGGETVSEQIATLGSQRDQAQQQAQAVKEKTVAVLDQMQQKADTRYQNGQQRVDELSENWDEKTYITVARRGLQAAREFGAAHGLLVGVESALSSVSGVSTPRVARLSGSIVNAWHWYRWARVYAIEGYRMRLTRRPEDRVPDLLPDVERQLEVTTWHPPDLQFSVEG